MAEAQRKALDLRGGKRRNNPWLVVGGVLAAVAAALAFVVWVVFRDDAGGAAVSAKPQAANMPGTSGAAPAVELPVGIESDWVDDDGKTLWGSPSHGPPIDLVYLPPGVEIILALRPAKLMAGSEGDKVVAALGPLGSRAIASVERTVGVKFSAIERLVVGWQIARDGSCLPTLVVTTTLPLAPASEAYQPPASGGRMTVFASPTTIAELRSLDGQPPPLARDVERVLAKTDSSRDVTLVFRPQFLLRGAIHVTDGELSRLLRWLDGFRGDDVAAASLSMNWDENFFVELVAVPTLDSSPEQMSEKLYVQVNELPELAEDYVLGLDVSPYGRRVVARLPEMVRKLAAYTRHGHDQDAALLRCYLPAAAGHNLLMGAELALAEGRSSRSTLVAAATSPAKMESRLQKHTSLRFAREELEAALDMLAEDVGVTVTIRGSDLQLEGITRNQLFAIDIADRPAAEILVEILRRANPDKLAAGPADPRQKLVYVVGSDAVIITTRSAAAERGERLPLVFQPK